MGSTLAELRALMEGPTGLGCGTTDATTEPTSSELNTVINQAIKKIIRVEKPHELKNETPSYLNQTIDTNYVELPSTVIIPQRVYIKTTGGTWRKVTHRNVDYLIQNEDPNSFLKDTKGDPNEYMLRGSRIIFNKTFQSSQTNAIAVYSTSRPTTLSNDTDVCELDDMRDLQILYQACALFYTAENEDTGPNLQKFRTLYKEQTDELRLYFSPDVEPKMRLDPQAFGRQGTDISNPNVLFIS